MATEQKQDSVSFFNVQKSYPPGEKLNIGYTLSAELKRSTRDWVGLFRVGWSSSRDYYTFEWAPSRPDDNLKGEVTFAGRRLPPEDNHFYQFCYVTSDGRVRGASPPFQFLAVSLARVDDLELVEVGEESLMILQPKKMREELEFIKRNESLRCEKELLTKQLEVAEKENETKLKEKDERITELERQLVTKQEAEAQLVEKLAQERAQNEAFNVAKQESEQRLSAAQEREQTLTKEINAAVIERESQESKFNKLLAEKDVALKSVKDENAVLILEMDDLRGQLQIKNAQVEDLSQLASTREEEKEQFSQEAEQLQQRILEVQQIRADLIEDNEAKDVKIEQLTMELATLKDEVEQQKKEIEELKQDVACAEENVAELVGAGPNAVIVHQPATAAPANHEEPPTQPPTQAAIIDRAAYDALLAAYDSLEIEFTKSKQAHREMARKVHDTEVRSDEMVARLEQAREEYEALARENHDLKKRGGRSPQPPSNKPTDKRIQEMESINKELVASCEVATQQLSERKEEMKKQLMRIEQLEVEIEQTKQEMDELKAEHERALLAKTEALDKQQAVLDTKLKEVVELQQVAQCLEKEKEKLEVIVKQLRSQLAHLKVAATTTDRTCPICQTKFPGRVSQDDYERHVQGHFENTV